MIALCSFPRYNTGRSLRLSSSLLQVVVLCISRPLSPIQSSRNRTFFPSGTFSSGPSNINSHFCLKSLNLLYMACNDQPCLIFEVSKPAVETLIL